jgi:hypothetical protein
LLVGLDVIGDWLTEINVTSPTCMVEIAEQTGFDAARCSLPRWIVSAPSPSPSRRDVSAPPGPAACSARGLQGRRCIIRRPLFSAPASKC